jgi:LemA protein
MAKYIIGCLGVAVIGIIILLIIGGLGYGGMYNGIVGQKQAVDAAWAEVENQYQRRADLVPNLVQTVSGAANF